MSMSCRQTLRMRKLTKMKPLAQTMTSSLATCWAASARGSISQQAMPQQSQQKTQVTQLS